MDKRGQHKRVPNVYTLEAMHKIRALLGQGGGFDHESASHILGGSNHKVCHVTVYS